MYDRENPALLYINPLLAAFYVTKQGQRYGKIECWASKFRQDELLTGHQVLQMRFHRRKQRTISCHRMRVSKNGNIHHLFGASGFYPISQSAFPIALAAHPFRVIDHHFAGTQGIAELQQGMGERLHDGLALVPFQTILNDERVVLIGFEDLLATSFRAEHY
ncbi:Uncharacterised protein [Vibrio cholerae]|nr:Uncharacterised protein [Vibrio cholerae]CSD36882.1 Uncharacterised protein [Vibrio cholerae]